jgi:hypothetical protein
MRSAWVETEKQWTLQRARSILLALSLSKLTKRSQPDETFISKTMAVSAYASRYLRDGGLRAKAQEGHSNIAARAVIVDENHSV